MEIHIGNLSSLTTVADLNRLLGFQDGPARCRIFKKQSRDGQMFYYGLAIVRPDAVGQRLIKRYRRATINGARVEVREFMPRRVSNERRALNWRNKPWYGPERRQSERRNTESPAAARS